MRLRSSLDYETQTSFTITITAQVLFYTHYVILYENDVIVQSSGYTDQIKFLFLFIKDQGNPAMSITITLMVNVLDQLEPAPTYTQEVYSVSISEGTYTSVCDLRTSSASTYSLINS